MADVFSMNDARNLLKDKFVLLIGDSNMRGIYKDLLCLLHQGVITPEKILRRGSEGVPQYGDEIIDIANLRIGRSYFEVRQCKRKELWVRFIFVTQVAAPTLMKELKSIEEGKLPPPDIVIVNSCLWDITRWGPEQEDQYKQNVANFFHRLQCMLPPASLVMWLASLPVATERVKGGVFIQQIEFIKHSMRFMLLEANMFIHNLCRVFGFSFLDLHYYMQYQLSRRTNDGLHWEPPAVRYMTNLILTHIALSFNEELPGNIDKPFLLQNHAKVREVTLEDEESKKIYLDSKIIKHLGKLGLQVKRVMDEMPSSERKKEKSQQKRVKCVARHPSRDGGSRSKCSSQSVSVKPPQSRGFVNPMSGRLSSHRDMRSSQYSVGMQVDGPSSQYFTGDGPLNSMQGPQPLFNNINVAWQLQSCGQQPIASQRYTNNPSRSYYQPDRHHFDLTHNEFWKDYPVNRYPWN
uniref:Uncharacterized protein n=1 Tax=Scylla olivacea TaxID=85551 RepID=A0A0P4VW82_SCYOL